MLRRLFRRRERTVGSAKKKRRYDLPLNKGSGTGFLILLIGLMTFLAMMALGASFALSVLQSRWSSGLENRATVEIPAEDHNGNLMTADEVRGAAGLISDMLINHPAVASAQVMPEDEIRDLVRPWLGDGLILNDMPLPGLISVTLVPDAGDSLPGLREKIVTLVPHARLDAHEGWLSEVLRFTGALKFAAALLVLTIGITTVTAISGAVGARMAVYRAEVELLHLMGATDNYIARQFQRYAMIAALQGGIGGTVVGAASIALIGLISGRMDVNLLPGFTLEPLQIAALCALPAFAAIIAVGTARQTVMRVLTAMP